MRTTSSWVHENSDDIRTVLYASVAHPMVGRSPDRFRKPMHLCRWLLSSCFLSLFSAQGEGVITLALLASLYTLPCKEAKRF